MLRCEVLFRYYERLLGLDVINDRDEVKSIMTCINTLERYVIVGYEGLARQVDLERELVNEYCVKNGGVNKGTEAGEAWFRTRFSTKKMLDYDATKGGTNTPRSTITSVTTLGASPKTEVPANTAINTITVTGLEAPWQYHNVNKV